MADLKLQIQGEGAKRAAAELGAALEFEFDPIGRVGAAPAPVLVAPPAQATAAQDLEGADPVAMSLGIPEDLLTGEGLEQKLHLLERLRRLIAIAEGYQENGTRVQLRDGDSLRDLAGMEPQDVLDAVQRSG